MITGNILKLIGRGLIKLANSSTSSSTNTNTTSKTKSQEEPTKKTNYIIEYNNKFDEFLGFLENVLFDEGVIDSGFSLVEDYNDKVYISAKAKNAEILLNYIRLLDSNKFQIRIKPTLDRDILFSNELYLDLPDHLEGFYPEHKFSHRRTRAFVLWILTMLEEIEVLGKLSKAEIEEQRQKLMVSLNKLLVSREFGETKVISRDGLENKDNPNLIQIEHKRYKIHISYDSSNLENPILSLEGTYLNDATQRYKGFERFNRYYVLKRQLNMPILLFIPKQISQTNPTYNRAEAMLTIIHLLLEDLLTRETEISQKVRKL